MKTKNTSVLVAGLALFSMFFGAGNLIFPPHIGLWAGEKFPLAIIGFLLSSVGLVLASSTASTKAGGSLLTLAGPLGKTFSLVFGTAVILAIGPMLAIPRTAATTCEILQGTLFTKLNPLLCSVIFFSCVLFFVLSPQNIIDLLGKGLTPALVLVLALILIKGFSSPLGVPADTGAKRVFSESFLEGYQTMDALAAMIFTSLVGDGLKKKGFTDTSSLVHASIKAALIAGIGLAAVYGGLLYIGATLSGAELCAMDRVSLLIHATEALLGHRGKYALSLAIVLACLTTAIGLTMTVGNFFEQISSGRLKRVPVCICSTLFSVCLSVKGVEAIVAIAGNVLSLLYPVAMVLIFLNLFSERFPEKATWQGAVFGALALSALSLLSRLTGSLSLFAWMAALPKTLSTFLWILPACFFGHVFPKLKKA